MRARRETWRGIARRAAYDYPSLKRAREELRQVRITPSLEAHRGQGSPARSTEAAALRDLQPALAHRLEAVENALAVTEELTSGPDRLRLARMVYFDRQKTLEGAALEIPVSVRQAYEWNTDFLLLIYGSMEAVRKAQSGPSDC